MSQPTPRSVLNQLIETCWDSERGFKMAAGLVFDATLKSTLINLATERARFALELAQQARRMGGDEAADGTAAAAVHRGWMDLLAHFSRAQDRTVLAEALRGDGVSLRIYERALHELLPQAIRELVEQQESVVRETHSRLERVLRELPDADSVVETGGPKR
jgi:uncharacterized protein (TIGR02284 family)